MIRFLRSALRDHRPRMRAEVWLTEAAGLVAIVFAWLAFYVVTP